MKRESGLPRRLAKMPRRLYFKSGPEPIKHAQLNAMTRADLPGKAHARADEDIGADPSSDPRS